MDLAFTPEQLAFQAELRAFVQDALPAAIRRKVEDGLTLDKDDYVVWQRKLYEKGWMAPNWPVAHGGTGWDPIQRYIFEQELAFGSTPRVIPFGVNMVGPVLIAFGDEAQKRRYLPRILSSEDWWCQGYSEPGAGSDLASLKTRAIPDGDDFVVTGTKTWTTLAQFADMMFCLVRTDAHAKPQEGISFLLIDMKSPGITVRPIITMDGGHEVNDVFLDEVRVPRDNLVGAINKGWTYAKFLLGHERFGIAAVARSKKQIERLRSILRAEREASAGGFDDRRLREKIALVEIELAALEITELRALSAEAQGRAPGPEASLLKIKGTEIQQTITELLLEAIGPNALPFLPENGQGGDNRPLFSPDHAAPIATHYFNWRKASIYGGSNEIQKNIIAKMVLGL